MSEASKIGKISQRLSVDKLTKPSKLGAEKLTPDEQRRRFIEAAREAGASEDEAEFDRSLGAIVKGKAPS